MCLVPKIRIFVLSHCLKALAVLNRNADTNIVGTVEDPGVPEGIIDAEGPAAVTFFEGNTDACTCADAIV